METTAKEKKELKKLPIRFLIFLFFFLGALLLLGYIIHEVLLEEEKHMDTIVADYVAETFFPYHLTSAIKVVAFFASSQFLLAAYTSLTAYYLFAKKDKLRATGIALIGITGYLITYSLKNAFSRQRPTEQLIETLTNFSFPSGHSTSAFLFYGLLIYLLWLGKPNKQLKIFVTIILGLIALLIGFSRIYLRVHFMSDVIAGFCIGLAWLLLAIWLIERMEKRRKDRHIQNEPNT